MMATIVTPSSSPAAFIDPSPPQSLLLFPTLIDQASLADLHELVRNRNYHAYRDAVTRVQLNELILANALITRLASLLYYAQTLLVRLVVEHTPAHNNTSDFVVLNQAAHELQKSITSKYTKPIEDTAPPLLTSPTSPTAYPSRRSFLDELSPTASTTLLNFLTSVRSDPSLLTSRLLHATDSELDALVSWKPNHHHRPSTSRHNSIPSAASPEDYILSFHRHDPLFILTSVIFSASENSLDRRRRLHCWSTCLAHLIDEKRAEQLVLAVLDIWSGSEWMVALPFETAILGFLQSAAKLRVKQKADIPLEDEGRTATPEMSELMDKTLVEVLEIIAGYGGIPSDVVELLNTVYCLCADKKQATGVLLEKWFIQRYLAQNFVYPEYRGILAESYISESQRQLLQLLYSHFVTRSCDNVTEYEKAIHRHLDDVTAKLLPTALPRFLTDDGPESPVQPAIVLCPSDILTVFYALHSKYRPPSPSQALSIPSMTRHNRKPSDESSRSDVIRMSSEYLRPILKKTNMFELHEDSASSQSEAASVEESPLHPENEEIDLYGLSIKAAIDEMKRRLGADVCNGERYPSEEPWVALHVEKNGSLSRMPDFEVTQISPGRFDDEIIISREDDEVIESALLKIAESAPKAKPQPIVDDTPSWQARNSSYYNDLILLTPPLAEPVRPIPSTIQESALLRTIQQASTKSFALGNHVQAQSYQHVKTLLQSITNGSLIQNDYSPVLGILARKIERQANHSIVQIRRRELCFSYLLSSQTRLSILLPTISNRLGQLQTKMWYINTVRDSKPFTRAKEVCAALEKMKSSRSLPSTVKRNTSAISLTRSSSMTRDKRLLRNSFDGFSFSSRPVSLYNVSLQSEDWMDILPAPTESGGPHKLSDYQIDVTTRWMEEHSLQNFCSGEEIIHRFCAEVDDVVRRTVPEMVDEMSSVASTFWESEEFGNVAREMGMLDVREEVPRTPSSMDVLGMLRSRGRTVEDTSDTRSIRSGHTRTTSLSVNNRHSQSQTLIRPSSSHSISFPPSPSPITSFFSRHPNPPAMTRSTSCIDEKAATAFLETMKQRLVALLLSDLGMEIWAGGSETDEWFSDGLADSCLERKRTRVRTPPGTIWGVTMRKEKKRAVVPGSMKPPPKRGFVIDESNDLPTPPLSRETSETGGPNATSTDEPLADVFSFSAAYKKLLTRFSVHPAPHEKLKALYDLEQLINASFTSAALAQNHATRSPGPQLPPTPRPSVESARSVSNSSAIGTDDLVDEIQRLLRDPKTRPPTLFRDLSFISAFVPPVALTHQAEGKVFWDIGLAASAMKTDVVNSMVDWYEEIMAGNDRSTSRHSRSLSSGGLKDAARMLVIAACEGHAVGQRELALLHLSHPSLLSLTTLPLSRPSDTFQKVHFKSANDKDKYDPDRIALATHWFRMAAKNGDKYAKSVEGNWLGSKNF